MQSMSDSQIHLIKAMKNSFGENLETLTNERKEEFLKSIAFIMFDNMRLLEASTDILDRGAVKEIVCTTSNRSCFTVSGSKGGQYLCLRNYCPCRSFFEQAKLNKGEIMVRNAIASALLFYRLFLVQALVSARARWTTRESFKTNGDYGIFYRNHWW